MAITYRPVKVAILHPAPGILHPSIRSGSSIPPGAQVDTTDGAGGFLGHVGSEYFSLDQATVIVGLRLVTTSGSFTTIGTGDEDPIAELKFTLYKIFENQGEEESMFSVSPEVDISGGSWSGTAGARLERATLLVPGNYRLDFSIALSESYEYDTVADIDSTLVVLKFESDYFTAPDGTRCVGMRMYTNYNLTTGAQSKTYYAWDEDSDDVPVAVDMRTYPKHPVDWCAQLLARKIAGIETPDRRTKLDQEGYIDNSFNPGGWIRAIQNMPSGADDGFGGALTEQTTVKAALLRILFENRHALDWTSYKARLLYIYRANDAINVQRVITMDDVARVADDDPIPKISVTWSDPDEVVNNILARYKRDYSQAAGERDSYLSSLHANSHLTSIQYIGKQEDEAQFLYDWIVRENWADTVTEAWLTSYARPKKLVEFEGFLNLLELQRGDIISFNLTPSITIGETGGSPDENQGYGEGGWGSAGFGGQEIIPIGTVKGEVFGGLLPALKFMVEQVHVNWTAKRVLIRAREVPGYT